LTGKKPTIQLPQTILPDVKDEDEEADVESPLTPTSAAWANSVFESLGKFGQKKSDSTADDTMKPVEVAPDLAGEQHAPQHSHKS
jgi:hypothetical protein